MSDDGVLKGFFPDLDEEIADYINGVIEHGTEDFRSADDVFEVIGGMLLEAGSENENDVKDLCQKLFNKVQLTTASSTSSQAVKVLEAPVHLESLAAQVAESKQTQVSDVWLMKKDTGMGVDQKKLEKAEAQLKKKQARRCNDDSSVGGSQLLMDNASVSQQSNRKDDQGGRQNKSADVHIENFDVAFGDRNLIKNADLHLVYGRRYGLVGRNGIGKTTLLRMISSGNIKIPSHISMLHVEQEVVGDDTLALDSVLECDTKRCALLAEEKSISSQLHQASSPTSDQSLNNRLATIYQQLEAIEADKAPARAAVILSGLGFSPDMQKQKTREFSGGWRMRLSLARALFTKPDLLLLDEPTNMLDLKAIIWLEDYLQNWPSCLLLVSHDREFLNMVASDVIHLFNSRLYAYRGNYENFLKARDERMKNQIREYEAQQQYRQHAQLFIDKFRYNAKRASLVQSKIKLLEKLPVLEPVQKDTGVTLRFPECEELSPPILRLDETSFYYSKDKYIFKNVDISASNDSRICIVGENGAGKTTLLKILLGDLDPVSGYRHAHRSLRIGYFTQHHVDQLDMNQTAVEMLATQFPGKTVEEYRGKLGLFGVSGELGVRPLASLSGGQKSRVAFAKMAMINPNFFILDEPTNHLDMETIEALGNALNKFPGGVILVSHDARLIEMICTELWVCSQGQVKALPGGLTEYKKIVTAELTSP